MGRLKVLPLQAIDEQSPSSMREVLILLHLFAEEAVDYGIYNFYVSQNFDCCTRNAEQGHNRFESECGMGNSFLKTIPVEADPIEVDGLWFWGIA